jgi:hypothetical protein
MRFAAPAVIAVALVALFSASAFAAAPDPDVTSKPLVEARGLPMSAQDAMERIAFHPFIPTPSYSEVALLPSSHGDDKDHPENRGIGFEYVSGGVTYFLSEWPVFPASLSLYPAMPPFAGCATGHSNMGPPQAPRSIAWTTSTVVYALQPDVQPGVRPNVKALRAEWLRLIKRGACR